ncbi:hypothetical protein AKG16_15240 [Morganella morganii]|nr:hypothetical protein AKG16_15240 [Morganella morganii]
MPDTASNKNKKAHFYMGLDSYLASHCQQILIGALFPLYCKQDIFIFYIQWLIFLLIGNTMKNTMLRKGLTIF